MDQTNYNLNFDDYSNDIMERLEVLTFKSFRLDEYIRRRIHELYWGGYGNIEAFKILARQQGYTV